MKPTTQSDSDDRAVSPVIGVILMVAITVILAAVIGTFVLGLGDQLGESAPQASFSTDNVTYDGTNISFDIEKTGGQDLTTSEVVLSVGGERYGDVNATSSGDLGESWQTGTTVWFDDYGGTLESDERVDIQLIHEPSGQAIYQTTVTVPEQ
ncbi:type IV pilin [Halorubrum trueperi]|uniref:Type IV pilin n=1 Tax=Halorubrum trueperi TaxID=2004704 RepID=A0ABD5UJL9_9EURY